MRGDMNVFLAIFFFKRITTLTSFGVVGFRDGMTGIFRIEWVAGAAQPLWFDFEVLG